MAHKLINAFSKLFSFFANLFSYENLFDGYDENMTDEEREQLERGVFIHSTMIF